MANGVNREIRFNIRADVDQAIRAITDMGREVDSVTGKAKGAFDAKTFNDNVRNSVGVLGDVDTAMQTLGSTLQIESLQIVGDMFAVGEAAGQLAGAMPELLSKFSGLSTTAIGAGVAIGAVTLAITALVAESQKLAQENTNAFNAQISAQEKALQFQNMSAEARLAKAEELQAQLDIIDAETAKARLEREQQWQDAVNQSGDFLARVSQAVGKDVRISEDAIIAQEQRADALRAELDALNAVGFSAEGATESLDTLSDTLQETSESEVIQRKYAESVKYVALNTEIASRKAEEYAQRLEGVSSGMAVNAKTLRNGRIVNLEEEKQAQEEIFEAQAQDREQAQREAMDAMEQAQRERERMWKEYERGVQRNIERVEDFERRKYEIEQGYRDATFEATLGNDVEAFISARRERRQSLKEASNAIVEITNLNVGEIATPADIDETMNRLTNAVALALSFQAGKIP